MVRFETLVGNFIKKNSQKTMTVFDNETVEKQLFLLKLPLNGRKRKYRLIMRIE